MPNTLISIIVPIYKVEPYIRKCVDSIIGQTYRQIEVILVDDGSPDNCGANAITASDSYLLYGSNDGDCSKKAINRESFMTLAAPQSFRDEVIKNLYKQVEERNLFETVKERHTNVFMEELGIPLYFSKGNHTNIKITTKEDIDLFLGYLLAKKYHEEHK